MSLKAKEYLAQLRGIAHNSVPPKQGIVRAVIAVVETLTANGNKPADMLEVAALMIGTLASATGEIVGLNDEQAIDATLQLIRTELLERRVHARASK